MNEGSAAHRALVQKFRTIAGERLERLNNAMLELEKGGGDASLRSLVLREIHTLKGEAKLMGFAEVNQVTHKLEDLLLQAKESDFRVSPEKLDFILHGFDLIGTLLTAPPPDSAAQVQTFMVRTEEMLRSPTATATATAPRPAQPAQAQAVAAPEPDRATTVAAPEPDRATISVESSIRVEVDRLDRLAALMGDLLRHHLLLDHALLELRQAGEEMRLELQRLRSTSARDADAANDDSARVSLESGDRNGRQRGLDITRLNGLQARVLAMLSRTHDDHHEAGDTLKELEAAARDLRLLPISSLFRRFRRAIRDIAHEQGKQVQVTITGGELELDKHVLDQIAEPLLHLIRNAVDHGIELPAQRRAAGKPEEGRIDLIAVQVEGHAEISVVDDGRGLSPATIRNAAVRRGLLGPEQSSAELSPDAMLKLIFSEGFSTKLEASELSGRGIGLRVVKDRLEALGGAVSASSEEGRGASMVLQVPISVALLRALVVEQRGGYFAIPAHTVRMVFGSEVDEVIGGDGKVIRVDGALVPCRELADLLGHGGSENASPAAGRTLVLQNQDQQLALRVERLLGERELIQRPLDAFIERNPLLIGTSLLEYARPTLILNVPELLRRAQRPQRRPAAAPDGPGQPDREQRLLLVEDSELTRDMLVSVVRRIGRQVMEASNGRDALELLQRQPPDLIITDLEMPVMDGFQLIEEVRRRNELAHVPIVVLSSLGSSSDKQRASELGADAYLTKSQFSEEALLETIGRFLQRTGRVIPS